MSQNLENIGKISLTPEEIANLTGIPDLILTPKSDSTPLSYMVDNSDLIFMRPVFVQWGASCSPSSGIGYTYTYEINRLRNLNDGIGYPENCYSPLYTFNYVNSGNYNNGSWWQIDWDIIKKSGIPNGADYDENFGKIDFRWMTGYDKYYRAMHNRLESYWGLAFNSTEDLNILKHWLNDHGNGEETGGLAVFLCFTEQWNKEPLPEGTPEAGKQILTEWGLYGGGFHAMTYVGYNDSIRFDADNNGIYTTTLDINGDSTVDMRDWEYGALKVVNSYGNLWPSQFDSGFIYVPYRLLPDNPVSLIMGLNAKDGYSPDLALKLKMSHEARGMIDIQYGLSHDCFANSPAYFDSSIVFNIYNGGKYGGGNLPMLGYGIYGPIEMGFDITTLLDQYANGRFFVNVLETNDTVNYDGLVDSLSIIDYRWDEELEIPCTQTNIPVNHNDTTKFTIDYFLLPFFINNTSYTVPCNSYCRKQVSVTAGSTLIIPDNTEIYFYKGTLDIGAGSNLIVGDNVKFYGLSKENRIEVYGNIEIGNNVEFIADEDYSIDLKIDNPSLDLILHAPKFERSIFECKPNSLIIIDAEFYLSGLQFSYGDLTMKKNVFEESFARINMAHTKSDFANIDSCTFNYYHGNSALQIDSYHIYTVENSVFIKNAADAIKICYAGGSLSNNFIRNNEIRGNGKPDTEGAGIVIYNSYANIYNNKIHENYFGILSLNNSEVKVYGNKLADSTSQTQQINNNSINQLFATPNSFPYHFRWNAVYSENITNPLLYISNNEISPNSIDVRYNYWGINYDTISDFYPTNAYLLNPVWNLLSVASSSESEENMFQTAQTNTLEGNYNEAEIVYKQLIQNYPATRFAKASLKELFILEGLSNNKYSDLKTYYLTDALIQNYSDLKKLAEFLGNLCDIKLENFPDAINWFENIIENPASMEDSIFAIIDLSHTYFLMENSGFKASCTGKFSQYKYSSIDEFDISRDYHIDLILKQKKDGAKDIFAEDPIDSRNNSISSIFPNPCTSDCSIQFSLDRSAQIIIRLFDNSGKEVKLLLNQPINAGFVSIPIDSSNLKNGVYFYTIEINGQRIESQKILLIK